MQALRYRGAMYLMAAGYIAAGMLHLVRPGIYLSIMPIWVPNPEIAVIISGFCEIVFGILLIPIRTRQVAAWLLIALLIAVFPANVQMAINFYFEDDPFFWIAVLRLPVQIVLIWWARLYTRRNTQQN